MAPRRDRTVDRQRVGREDDPVGHEHVVGVELAFAADVDVVEVAEALPDRLVLGPQDGEDLALDAVGGEGGDGALGARGVEAPVEDQHPVGGGPVGERRLERQADHLLGGALGVVARLGGVDHATAGPDRRAAGAGPGAAGALLLPGLGATTAHLGAGLGGLGAGPAGGQLGGDDLVHHRRCWARCRTWRRRGPRSRPLAPLASLVSTLGITHLPSRRHG